MLTATELLYEYARGSGITVDSFKFKGEVKSLAVVVDAEKCIAIDYSKVETSCEERQILAEEIGHLENRSLYHLSDYCSPIRHLIIAQAEYKSRCFALKLLIPIGELKEVSNYCTEIWELAEHFNVPEEIITSAVEYYRTKGLF